MPNYQNQGWTPPNGMMPAWTPNQQYPQPSQYANPGSHIYNQQQQAFNNLLRVTGPESAKAYQLPPNSSAVLFDADNPTFYLVSTDDSGFKSMRTFDFSERKQVEVQPVVEEHDMSAFATKDDLNELKEEMAKVAEALKGLM